MEIANPAEQLVQTNNKLQLVHPLSEILGKREGSLERRTNLIAMTAGMQ